MRLLHYILILNFMLIVTGCSPKTDTEKLDLLAERINNLEENINDFKEKIREPERPVDLLQILKDNGWKCDVYGINCSKSQDVTQPGVNMLISEKDVTIILNTYNKNIKNYEYASLRLISPYFSDMSVSVRRAYLTYYIYNDNFHCSSSDIYCDEYIDENEKVIDEVKSTFDLILNDLDISIEDLMYFHRYYFMDMDNIGNYD
ncbi:hypothetical protein RI065_09710 [Mycoplasmatota bacterium zrk1]